MSASEKSGREWRWEGGRESGISTEELEVGPRSAQRHARRDDQREREGPCCSAMKAQPRNPLSRATQLNSRSRRPPAVVEPMTPPPSPSIIRPAAAARAVAILPGTPYRRHLFAAAPATRLHFAPPSTPLL